MPGLFGVIAKNRGLAGHSRLEMGRRMADSMRHKPWLRAEIWGDEAFCGGRVHLGVQNPDPQPLVSKGGLTRAWFDGDYYPTSIATSSTTPSAEEIGELVANSGARLANIDGIFNLASYDLERRELILANDRLGFRPLYYTETEDWFAYAGEVKALLAICDKLPDLDEISLRQFFGFDHMLGDRTWWKGIELLPPASVWRVSPKGRTKHQYWSFNDIRRDPREPAEIHTELSRLWAQDVTRHSKPGTMPLLLSGGQDSRLLLAELHAQGADLIAITFGGEESADVKIARRVAAVSGVPHRLCHLNVENWWHHREEAIWQTDGLINGFNFQAAIAMDEMHTGNWYSPMNIAGDLIFGGSYLDRNLMSNWRLSPTNLLAARHVENLFFGLDEILSVSVADAQRYLHGPSSDCFHLRQRMRRFTLYGSVCLASQCEMVFPGVNHALVQLILGSLSDEDRIGHKFYNRWLVMRRAKYFGDIPWQATGRGLAESFPTRLSRGIGWRLNRLIGKRAKRTASDQWFVNYPACVRESRIRERLLREDLITDTFLGGAAKRALTNDKSRPLSAQGMIAILTLETYLRQVAGMPSVTGLISRFPEQLVTGRAV